MRQSWIGSLLFALALAFQAAAPVAASVAMERAALSDGLCSAIADRPAAKSKRAGSHDAGRGLCSLCELCCSGAAPVEAKPASIVFAPVNWTRDVAWMATDDVLPALRHDRSRQPRAPPFSC
jgi:hypothetical protein